MEEIKATGTTDKGGNAAEPAVVKPLEGSQNKMNKPEIFSKKSLVIYALMIILGLVAGTGVYAFKSQGTTRIGGQQVEVVKTANEEGVKDASNFKDTATGKVIANDGKLTNEGTHILVRGDPSQNVYLTSAVIDLSKYENKNVQVWGETYKGQKAGWLMDVGRVKVAN